MIKYKLILNFFNFTYVFDKYDILFIWKIVGGIIIAQLIIWDYFQISYAKIQKFFIIEVPAMWAGFLESVEIALLNMEDDWLVDAKRRKLYIWWISSICLYPIHLFVWYCTISHVDYYFNKRAFEMYVLGNFKYLYYYDDDYYVLKEQGVTFNFQQWVGPGTEYSDFADGDDALGNDAFILLTHGDKVLSFIWLLFFLWNIGYWLSAIFYKLDFYFEVLRPAFIFTAAVVLNEHVCEDILWNWYTYFWTLSTVWGYFTWGVLVIICISGEWVADEDEDLLFWARDHGISDEELEKNYGMTSGTYIGMDIIILLEYIHMYLWRYTDIFGFLIKNYETRRLYKRIQYINLWGGKRERELYKINLVEDEYRDKDILREEEAIRRLAHQHQTSIEYRLMRVRERWIPFFWFIDKNTDDDMYDFQNKMWSDKLDAYREMEEGKVTVFVETGGWDEEDLRTLIEVAKFEDILRGYGGNSIDPIIDHTLAEELRSYQIYTYESIVYRHADWEAWDFDSQKEAQKFMCARAISIIMYRKWMDKDPRGLEEAISILRLNEVGKKDISRFVAWGVYISRTFNVQKRNFELWNALWYLYDVAGNIYILIYVISLILWDPEMRWRRWDRKFVFEKKGVNTDSWKEAFWWYQKGSVIERFNDLLFQEKMRILLTWYKIPHYFHGTIVYNPHVRVGQIFINDIRRFISEIGIATRAKKLKIDPQAQIIKSIPNHVIEGGIQWAKWKEWNKGVHLTSRYITRWELYRINVKIRESLGRAVQPLINVMSNRSVMWKVWPKTISKFVKELYHIIKESLTTTIFNFMNIWNLGLFHFTIWFVFYFPFTLLRFLGKIFMIVSLFLIDYITINIFIKKILYNFVYRPISFIIIEWIYNPIAYLVWLFFASIKWLFVYSYSFLNWSIGPLVYLVFDFIRTIILLPYSITKFSFWLVKTILKITIRLISLPFNIIWYILKNFILVFFTKKAYSKQHWHNIYTDWIGKHIYTIYYYYKSRVKIMKLEYFVERKWSLYFYIDRKSMKINRKLDSISIYTRAAFWITTFFVKTYKILVNFYKSIFSKANSLEKEKENLWKEEFKDLFTQDKRAAKIPRWKWFTERNAKDILKDSEYDWASVEKAWPITRKLVLWISKKIIAFDQKMTDLAEKEEKEKNEKKNKNKKKQK